MRCDAVFSPCGQYRLRLDRDWAEGRRACGLLLNPSVAGKDRNDATVGTFTSFCRVWGLGGFTFVNMFALISTDPDGLVNHPDPVGPENDAHILAAVEAADIVVCAWGARVPPARRDRVDHVLEMIGAARDLWCFGTNADSSPKHPLRLKHTTPLVRYFPPRAA